MSGPLSSTAGNPFSASRVRPGAAAFIFSPGLSGENLVERLRKTGWRGQIVGPHGSGKSTLLATLRPLIEQAGQSVLSIALHDGQRRLPREFLAAVTFRCSGEQRSPSPSGRGQGEGALPIDAPPALHPHLDPLPEGEGDGRCMRPKSDPGDPIAEKRTSPRARILVIDGYEQLSWWSRLLLRRLCRRRAIGLLVTSHRPVELPETYRTAVDLTLARRVVEQLQTGFPPKVAAEDIAEPLARHQGNLREALFDLYDVYEARKGI